MQYMNLQLSALSYALIGVVERNAHTPPAPDLLFEIDINYLILDRIVQQGKGEDSGRSDYRGLLLRGSPFLLGARLGRE